MAEQSSDYIGGSRQTNEGHAGDINRVNRKKKRAGAESKSDGVGRAGLMDEELTGDSGAGMDGGAGAAAKVATAQGLSDAAASEPAAL